MFNNLRKIRTDKLLTQKELAKKAKVSQVTISLAENGFQNPSDLTRVKLAKALKVPVEELFPPGQNE